MSTRLETGSGVGWPGGRDLALCELMRRKGGERGS